MFQPPRKLGLAREDAVKLVERVLNREEAGAGAAADAAREAIEQLVEAVHGHARTLALLAPALRSGGVEATRASLVELMAEMERKFPGSREQSVFASVELSLRRLSPANRDKARVLGVFQGGDCLLPLGRLDDAAAAYEECIRRLGKLGDDRGVAVGKGQLGTVRMNQRRYQDALKAYEEAREQFTRLDEPGSVSVIWHQTGVVYQQAGQSEAAENAYRKSLAIAVRLGDVAGQASTLGQLGLLYDGVLDRPEEAVAFCRQAADKYVEIGDVAGEGRQRNNLGNTLRKLRRLDEARQEIRRAFACDAQFGHASEPSKTWAILADIDADAGKPAAAAEAKRKAIESYLAYRRDGGENHSGSGRLCLAMTQRLLASDSAAALSLLQDEAATYQAAGFGPFIQALQAIVAGSRDRALAGAPDLDYAMAAEILFLLDELEKAGR